MLKVKKKRFTRLKINKKNQISQIQNDLKNSTKDLYLSNKKKDKKNK